MVLLFLSSFRKRISSVPHHNSKKDAAKEQHPENMTIRHNFPEFTLALSLFTVTEHRFVNIHAATENEPGFV